jgi:hypothetical protein
MTALERFLGFFVPGVVAVVAVLVFGQRLGWVQLALLLTLVALLAGGTGAAFVVLRRTEQGGSTMPAAAAVIGVLLTGALYALVGPPAIGVGLVLATLAGVVVATTRARDRRLAELAPVDAKRSGRGASTIVVSIAAAASERRALLEALQPFERMGARTDIDRAFRVCEAIAERLGSASSIAITAQESGSAAIRDLKRRDARERRGGYREDASDPLSSEGTSGSIVLSLALSIDGAPPIPEPPSTRDRARASLMALPPLEIERTTGLRIWVEPSSDDRSFEASDLATAFPELRAFTD